MSTKQTTGEKRKRASNTDKTKLMEPNKPYSAYILFCIDVKQDITEDVSLSAKEVLYEMSKRWKLLSDKQKKSYDDLHTTNKQEYQQLKCNFDEQELLQVEKKRNQ